MGAPLRSEETLYLTPGLLIHRRTRAAQFRGIRHNRIAMFFWIKLIHVTAVMLTLCLFCARAVWSLRGSDIMQRRWVRIVPHVVDTVLLLSGAALAWLIRQYPPASHWLDAKLLALIAYILLGTVALKRGPTAHIRVVAGIGALAVFGYIVSVAVTMNPAGFLVFLR